MFGNSILGAVFCLLCCGVFERTYALPSPPHSYGGDNAPETMDHQDESTRIDSSLCSLMLPKVPLCSSYDTCLAPPPKGSKPVLVVLGVGTQNYTCSSPNSKPVPNGAVATLYDITCVMAAYPTAAHYSSAVAMRMGFNSLQDTRKVPQGLGYPIVGKHYFTPDAKTAVFEAQSGGRYLKFTGGRLEGIPAPANAIEGTVDWLRLGRKQGYEKKSNEMKFVYRVYTAGGKPPATCKGLQQQHTVNYATEYWFYD